MTALITGACGGLGRALAAACAQAGLDLYLTDRCPRALAALSAGLRRQYGGAVWTKDCNLTEARAVEALFADIDRRGLRLHLLFNVAGVDHEGPFRALGVEQVLEIVQLNVASTLRVTHMALSRRAPGQRFAIVNVSSLASLYPMPLKATYAASKRFLLDFSCALGQELAGEGVYVLALCPGGLPTTPEAVEGIAAQGFWGEATANRVERVARESVRRALRGLEGRGGRGPCGLYIPGAVNRVFGALGSLLPRAWVARLVYERWRRARAARHPV